MKIFENVKLAINQIRFNIGVRYGTCFTVNILVEDIEAKLIKDFNNCDQLSIYGCIERLIAEMHPVHNGTIISAQRVQLSPINDFGWLLNKAFGQYFAFWRWDDTNVLGDIFDSRWEDVRVFLRKFDGHDEIVAGLKPWLDGEPKRFESTKMGFLWRMTILRRLRKNGVETIPVYFSFKE